VRNSRPNPLCGLAKLHAENPHGCGFSAAQAIVAEILFAYGKKIGADSAVCGAYSSRKCALLPYWI
jgi:hypothetical protein